MKWWPQEPKPGDMIRVTLGSIRHYGVFVSDKEIIQFGLPPVGNLLDRTDVRVVASDASVFCCGQIPEVGVPDRRESKKRFSPEETVRRARARLGEGGYNLIHNNCEHFAYECVFGLHFSAQEEEARARWRAQSGAAVDK